jgi:hypothetical protein
MINIQGCWADSSSLICSKKQIFFLDRYSLTIWFRFVHARSGLSLPRKGLRIGTLHSYGPVLGTVVLPFCLSVSLLSCAGTRFSVCVYILIYFGFLRFCLLCYFVYLVICWVRERFGVFGLQIERQKSEMAKLPCPKIYGIEVFSFILF